MVTCEECGKTNGTGKVGDHWICADCKMDAAGEPADDGQDGQAQLFKAPSADN